MCVLCVFMLVFGILRVVCVRSCGVRAVLVVYAMRGRVCVVACVCSRHSNYT